MIEFKRKAEKTLQEWYSDASCRHLYVKGLRGTGKTTLIRRFVDKLPRNNSIYIDFETDFGIRSYFKENFKGNITDVLKEYSGNAFDDASEMILILDEPHLTGILRDMIVNISSDSDSRIILIDSEGTIDDDMVPADFYILRLKPLTFEEFLDNTGKEWYREVITGHYEKMKPVPSLVDNEIKDIFDDYLQVGGMPAAVSFYISNDNNIPDTGELIGLQLKELRNIIRAFQEDENSDCSKMVSLLDGIIDQNIRQSRHFAYGRVVKGSTGQYYSETLDKMLDTGLVCRSSSDNDAHFRLFWPDIGLLNAKIMSSYGISGEITEKILISTYIAQELSAKRRDLKYWYSENSSETDQLIALDDTGRRLAVKYIGSSKKKVRSLEIYDKIFPNDAKIAVGDMGFNIMGNFKIIPQYAVFCLIY